MRATPLPHAPAAGAAPRDRLDGWTPVGAVRLQELERHLDGQAHPPPADGLLTLLLVGCAGLIPGGLSPFCGC